MLMGDGNPAPGPVPDTWTPGTWTTKVTFKGGTIAGYSLVPPVTGECVLGPEIPQAGGVVFVDGPCWGLYKVEVAGQCGGYSSREIRTAVIGDGFSYWMVLSTGGGTYGVVNTTGIELENIFTPV
jgi:hypothetical protein